ncbi:MAG: NAD-dependent epimerase/dehydratase family protein, partial [Anaerolineales bacterium]
TPSVYFADQPRRDVAEGDPLSESHLSAYAATKLLAEQVVARAHAAGLPVISIRPRAIIGPGDTALLPRLIRPLRTGLLPVIGDGQNLADLTCVENVVDALLLCAQAPDQFLGRTYNVTNGQPTKLWDLVRKLCGLLGYPPPRWRLPLPAALALAAAIEAAYAAARPQREPPLTRFAVRGLALDATLNINAARRDLGYAPRVSLDEGLEQFARWWQAGHP